MIPGGGPSGLVAAKHLLQVHPEDPFSVTIYESKPRIGGLWPKDVRDTGGLISPCMIVNQSRHSVQFSDLSWPSNAPQFPPAFLVGEYLERYREKYCRHVQLRLNAKVVATQLKADSTWSVRASSLEGKEENRMFDYLLITTGFFGVPRIPQCVPAESSVPIIHSSQYRSLSQLIPSSSSHGGKILVVGGQMSGVETAATIATHLSSARHSPSPSKIAGVERLKVHHVIERPLWVLPLFTTPEVGQASHHPQSHPC